MSVNIAQDSEEMSELIKRKYYPGHTKKEMEFKFDDHTENIIYKNKIGFLENIFKR